MCDPASAALDSLSTLVCGRDNAFEVDDSYGVVDNLAQNEENRRKKRDTESGNSPPEDYIPAYDLFEMRQFDSKLSPLQKLLQQS